MENLLYGVLGASARPKAITGGLKPCLPLRFQRILDHGLRRTVDHRRNPEGSLFAVRLGDIDTSHRECPDLVSGSQCVHKSTPCPRGSYEYMIDARCLCASVSLSDTSNAD